LDNWLWRQLVDNWGRTAINLARVYHPWAAKFHF